ncbi:MAG: DNA protecting protein DprA [Candidatus Komeilibacteria bacterium RIFOXYD2_FULL_37_8]|nr:MAG: DNA protecting protein DprA [Candidatus Komeilibacteria bacterium RIFOXYD1_FULL_37_29]OGY96272.1 MAG: DNA protecting protein DprA [Candidatus Komeilibacteria bacterium RIFOXYD2_FULL_37_8]
MKSDFANSFYLFLFSQVKGLGSNTIISLLKKCGSPQDLYRQALTGSGLFNNTVSEQLRDKNFISAVKKSFTDLCEDYITILDPLYPPNLKNIYDPPLFLFYRGAIALLKNDYLLTVVGSRTSTDYHRNCVHNIFQDLKNTPLIIVSGLAIGIDTLCHKKALENNLKTIAVLGSGLSKDRLYPQENVGLATEIIQNGGLIISEQSAKVQTQLYHFPKRNRILAGLSKATLVISGAEKSGTLITAQVALDEGREVLALPANINMRLSYGPNKLIKEGATLLDSAKDIFKIYNLEKNCSAKKILFKNKYHAKIYTLLQTESMNLVDLSARLDLPLAQLNIFISEMEIAGLIKSNYFNQLEIL